jgi:hypothetical protein
MLLKRDHVPLSLASLAGSPVSIFSFCCGMARSEMVSSNLRQELTVGKKHGERILEQTLGDDETVRRATVQQLVAVGRDLLLLALRLNAQAESDGGDAEQTARTPSVLEERFPDVYVKMTMLSDSGRDGKSMRSYLQAFAVVIKTGSFYRAAPLLELEGHKGVSYRIRKLEEALGVSLAVAADENGRKKIEITNVGKALGEWIALHPHVIG